MQTFIVTAKVEQLVQHVEAKHKGRAEAACFPRIDELRTSFAYSLFVRSFHACRDRVVLVPPCGLHGAATLRPAPLGPGRA